MREGYSRRPGKPMCCASPAFLQHHRARAYILLQLHSHAPVHSAYLPQLDMYIFNFSGLAGSKAVVLAFGCQILQRRTFRPQHGTGFPPSCRISSFEWNTADISDETATPIFPAARGNFELLHCRRFQTVGIASE